jgi:hypothetical protein
MEMAQPISPIFNLLQGVSWDLIRNGRLPAGGPKEIYEY